MTYIKVAPFMHPNALRSHSGSNKTPMNIENFLAEILFVTAGMRQNLKYINEEERDSLEDDINMIENYVRRAWDLVPEE